MAASKTLSSFDGAQDANYALNGAGYLSAGAFGIVCAPPIDAKLADSGDRGLRPHRPRTSTGVLWDLQPWLALCEHGRSPAIKPIVPQLRRLLQHLFGANAAVMAFAVGLRFSYDAGGRQRRSQVCGGWSSGLRKRNSRTSIPSLRWKSPT